MSFTDGKPLLATEEHLKAPWSGKRDGSMFRCRMCGYKFQLGDYWRFVYTNDIPGAGGNPLVCERCDGGDVCARWVQMCEEARTKFWWFTQEC